MFLIDNYCVLKESFLVLFGASEMGIIAPSYFQPHRNDGTIEGNASDVAEFQRKHM